MKIKYLLFLIYLFSCQKIEIQESSDNSSTNAQITEHPLIEE